MQVPRGIETCLQYKFRQRNRPELHQIDSHRHDDVAGNAAAVGTHCIHHERTVIALSLHQHQARHRGIHREAADDVRRPLFLPIVLRFFAANDFRDVPRIPRRHQNLPAESFANAVFRHRKLENFKATARDVIPHFAVDTGKVRPVQGAHVRFRPNVGRPPQQVDGFVRFILRCPHSAAAVTVDVCEV